MNLLEIVREDSSLHPKALAIIKKLTCAFCSKVSNSYLSDSYSLLCQSCANNNPLNDIRLLLGGKYSMEQMFKNYMQPTLRLCDQQLHDERVQFMIKDLNESVDCIIKRLQQFKLQVQRSIRLKLSLTKRFYVQRPMQQSAKQFIQEKRLFAKQLADFVELNKAQAKAFEVFKINPEKLYSSIRTVVNQSLENTCSNLYGLHVTLKQKLEGEIKSIKQNLGVGFWSNEQGHYFGQLKKGQREGWGTFVFNDTEKYQGQWKNDKMEGWCAFSYDNGDIYIGQNVDGSQQGTGTYYHKSGDRYSGDFANNQRVGQGRYVFSDGEIYEGEWREGQLRANDETKSQSGETQATVHNQ